MDLNETSRPEWWADPVNVAELFLMLLTRGQTTNLDDFVTPESESSWGDFTEAQTFLNSIAEPAIVKPAQVHSLADDVAFVGLLNSSLGYEVDEESTVFAAGFVTLVWRSEFERWMVSSLGIGREPLPNIARSKP